MNCRLMAFCRCCILVGFAHSVFAQQLAFPGAGGFGRFTSGGRGGRVFEVNNLSDGGQGSLRAAVEAKGARIVVFRVSGNIALKSPLRIKQPDITIAGQTAPGDGICVRDYPVLIETENVILRYLRIRLGDVHKLEEDALSCLFQKNIIIDHCSISWGIDEVATVRDNVNSTVQWCIISESLNDSYHHKGKHGYGGIWGGQGASFHHNLIAHNASRNPRFNGSRYSGAPDKELVDFRNNVIYNWGFNSAYGGEGGRYNLVANYYKSGPASRHKDRIVEAWDTAGKWYVADNFVSGYPDVSERNSLGVQADTLQPDLAENAFSAPEVTTQQAQNAFELVLRNAGAVRPKRDSVDSRIVEEVRTGRTTYGNGIIDTQKTAGGWPDLSTYDVPVDSDHDGMPDTWELSHMLDPTDASDQNGDINGNGYTNIEDYLNSLTENSF